MKSLKNRIKSSAKRDRSFRNLTLRDLMIGTTFSMILLFTSYNIFMTLPEHKLNSKAYLGDKQFFGVVVQL